MHQFEVCVEVRLHSLIPVGVGGVFCGEGFMQREAQILLIYELRSRLIIKVTEKIHLIRKMRYLTNYFTTFNIYISVVYCAHRIFP